MLTLAGLVACVAVWSVRGRPARIVKAALLACWALGFAGYALIFVTILPGYGTDAMAFDQRAAELLTEGVNPYGVSLADSLDRFMVPEQYHTWLLDGGEVEQLSYPALSFLVYVPAILLGGGGMQLAFAVNVAGWIATVIVAFAVLPARIRWAAPVLGSLGTYVDFAVGGVTDMLFMPFLVVALWRWDRYGDPGERSMARWAGPIALALAMCVKQTPWLVLPLVLVGLGLEAHARGPRPGRWRLPARYLAVVAGVFALVNAPFLVWDPGAFVHGMLLPLIEDTVPAGQGIITLALFQQLGGQLPAFKLAGLVTVPLTVLVWTVGYRRLKVCLVALVAIVFFWSTRSFASYLVDLLPAALVAGATVRPAPSGATLGRLRAPARIATAAGSAAFVACVAVALLWPQPLELRVVDFRTTGQQQSVREITVRVRNTTGADVAPVFSVMSGAYLTRAWRPRGSAVVPADGEAEVTLVAPNQQAMPALEGGWIVAAFTPASLSTSADTPSATDRLSISPSVVNDPVALGAPVVVQVQLRNRLGAPRRKAGVAIALGQVVYTENGILAGETRINGHRVGQSPVTTTTDRRGIARFTIVGAAAQRPPVWFQAWIDPEGSAPHAYSQQLSIRFRGRR